MRKEPSLNVLIIGEYFPPDIGGAATRASNVAKGLTLNGCNVTVVSAFPHYPTGKIPKEYNRKLISVEYAAKCRVFRTFVLPLESKGLFRRFIVFWSFMLSSLVVLPFVGEIDVIWAANPDVFVLVPAVVYGALKRKPVVSNVDDLIIEDLYDLDLVKRGSMLSRVAEQSARVLFAKVKFATPISPGYVNTIRKYGVDSDKIVVVRGGVDLDVFKPYPKHEDNGKFKVLYSGGFSVAYDFDIVFRAAHLIEKIDDNIEFILQGKGELLNTLNRRVKELKLMNVRIIDELFSREAVGRFLNETDVLILPLAAFKTPYRGMSSKLYEYQAVGKPIICCSNGLPSKYVSDTQSGLVVNCGDTDGLVRAVLELKNDPASNRFYGDSGRRWVEKEASIQAIGLKMKNILSFCK